MIACNLANSTWKNKYTAVTSSWELRGYIRVAIMPARTTISSNACVAKLTKLRALFLLVRKVAEILFQHDNFLPHVSLRSIGDATKLGWIVLPHPTSPSYFGIF
jgi:hypothetical protein